MKRVLVTGAAGFLGSHICERFLNENFELVIVNDGSTDHSKNIILELHEVNKNPKILHTGYMNTQFMQITQSS